MHRVEHELSLEESDSSSIAIHVEIRPDDLFGFVVVLLAVSAQHRMLKLTVLSVKLLQYRLEPCGGVSTGDAGIYWCPGSICVWG